MALLVLLWGPASSSHASQRTAPQQREVAGTVFVVDAAAGMEGFVRAVVQVIERRWEDVAETLGAPPGETITVHIERRLEDYFVREGLAYLPPEWAAGLAIGSRRTFLLAPGNPAWEATAVHEMAHLAIDMAAGWGAVPRWVHEGLAISVAEQWDLERATTMLRAGVFGNYFGLEELTSGFPRAASMADLAYAQAFSMVRHMRQVHGDDVYRRIFARMRETGEKWGDALVSVTGVPPEEHFEAWRAQARTTYRWIPLMGTAGAGWTLASVLLVMAWRRKRREKAARLARMARDEEVETYPLDPDDEVFG